jgi:mono/diheme cytochrome c family protein
MSRGPYPGAFVLGLLLSLPAGSIAAPGDDVDEFDGGGLYANHCANCHGLFGEGDGIITPSLAVVL